MTALDLVTLSERTKQHKNALIHIVKPQVFTERALHYSEAYQQHQDKPLPVRRALALADHLQQRTVCIKNDELIIGNQASQLRAAPIFPEYTVSWIESEIDELADRPGAGFSVSEADKTVLHQLCPWWRGQTVQDRCTGMSFINFARVMLVALEQGRDATSGQVFLPQEQGLSKGNFSDFAQVMAQWDAQIRYYTRKSIEIECVVDTILEENAHDIVCSALVDDCIERGKSIKQGGARYDWVSGLQVGIANLGNSLAAVRKLVFEPQLISQKPCISQKQLASALANDFAGLNGEQLRQHLINSVPKYGNDVDDVDQLLVRAYQTYIDELKQYHNTRFGRGPIGGGGKSSFWH